MRRYILPVLAFYLDFILVNTFVALASTGLGRSLGYIAGTGTPHYVEIGLSVALVGLARALGVAPSPWLLEVVSGLWNDPGRPRLWPNLIVGTLFVLDGLKQMIRWSQIDVVLPVFGMVETSPLKIASLICLGSLYIVAGAMLLRLMRHARLFGAAVLGMSMASLALSWQVLPEALARAQIARRDAQGLSVREGEVETMLAIMPRITAAFLTILLVLLWISSERNNAARV